MLGLARGAVADEQLVSSRAPTIAKLRIFEKGFPEHIFELRELEKPRFRLNLPGANFTAQYSHGRYLKPNKFLTYSSKFLTSHDYKPKYVKLSTTPLLHLIRRYEDPSPTNRGYPTSLQGLGCASIKEAHKSLGTPKYSYI